MKFPEYTDNFTFESHPTVRIGAAVPSIHISIRHLRRHPAVFVNLDSFKIAGWIEARGAGSYELRTQERLAIKVSGDIKMQDLQKEKVFIVTMSQGMKLYDGRFRTKVFVLK